MYYKYFKKPTDKILASMILVFASPIALIVSIIIKLESKGPVLFKQPRTGLNGKEFNLYKFRSMTANNSVHDFTKENQITKIGKIIRRFSIDELPQMINILKGEMSFIGPRPWIPDYYKRMTATQKQRVSVLPGVTGLAQVKGRNSLTINKKIEYDLVYVKQISLREDLKVIFFTIKATLEKSVQEIEKCGIYQELQILESQQKNSKERG